MVIETERPEVTRPRDPLAAYREKMAAYKASRGPDYKSDEEIDTVQRGPEYDSNYDTSDSESDNEDDGKEYFIAARKKGMRTIERAMQLWLDRKKRLDATGDGERYEAVLPIVEKKDYDSIGERAFGQVVIKSR